MQCEIRLLVRTKFIEMKNRVRYCTNVITFIAASFFLNTACTNNFSKTTNTPPANQSSTALSDSDGNTYTTKIMLDNKQWMTANLKINMLGSYCYDNDATNCSKYGRLYTWESAKKACAALGNGWRLPTDDEWKQMASHYGGVHKDSLTTGKAAYKSLLHGGDSEFNALLGGSHFTGQYTRLEAHGFYWTTTEEDTAMAWFYNFGKGSQNLYRQANGEKSRAFLVRCIKD